MLASENALLWDFPGEAVAVPYESFSDTHFRQSLAGFLEQASTESIKQFSARAAKAGSYTIESRDTASPDLITQMLMTLLEANGSRVYPSFLRKRIRDDVYWTGGAENPWRRSALWQVIRVGVERFLCFICGAEAGRAQYKVLLCTLISQLIDDSLRCVSPELLELLKGKLARRLSKLQIEQGELTPKNQAMYAQILVNMSPHFRNSIRAAVECIKSHWSEVKSCSRRPIPTLPLRASRASCTLSLRNSASYLEQVLAHHQALKNPNHHLQNKSSAFTRGFAVPEDNTFRAFAERYYILTELESSNGAACSTHLEGRREEQSFRCMSLAAKIETYLDAVSGAYENISEQKSLMILNAMRLWVTLDQQTCSLFGLLKDFHPGIAPEILEILQLPTLVGMVHLQTIQTYLQRRCYEVVGRTIFDKPGQGCFAERYYDESDDSGKLRALHLEIDAKARLALQKKEDEWRKQSAEFEDLERKIVDSHCALKTDDFGSIEHDSKHCQKCYFQRVARRMRIGIHEYPLPSNISEAKAVVFELACPGSFKTYRRATWKLLCTLAGPQYKQSQEPRLMLNQYSEIREYAAGISKEISLASKAKSFLLTHYKELPFPVALEDICRPNGLKLSYYDARSKLWASEQPRLQTLAHHFKLSLPSSSPFSSLGLAVGSSVPSSYEIIASQMQCPSGLNVHEFMAYKGLFAGNSRRWPSILIELGSANMNLSTEAATALISQLALQAGPADQDDHLRIAHRIFRDETFCRKLMEQISQRLESIATNWKETHCMNMLLTLILRLNSIGHPSTNGDTLAILEMSRDITFGWISQLRRDIYQSSNVAAAERLAGYAFLAALLYRKTFSIYVSNDRAKILGADETRRFIEASITLQDNAPRDLAQMPFSTKSLLIRDLKMVHLLRSMLRESFSQTPQALYCAVNAFWYQHEGHVSGGYFDFEFLDSHPN